MNPRPHLHGLWLLGLFVYKMLPTMIKAIKDIIPSRPRIEILFPVLTDV